jgi:hypothetical protein
MAEEKPFTLSDEIRYRFGIAMETPMEDINPTKIAWIRRELKKEGVVSSLRGKAAEVRFVEAWRDAGEKWKFWFDSVRPATWHEDHKQATDAFIRTVNGDTIRIQVKITRPGEGICSSLRVRGIVLVLVDPADTYEKIRYNTMVAIKEHATYQKERYERRV